VLSFVCAVISRVRGLLFSEKPVSLIRAETITNSSAYNVTSRRQTPPPQMRRGIQRQVFGKLPFFWGRPACTAAAYARPGELPDSPAPLEERTAEL
jgi:hypothetical protein